MKLGDFQDVKVPWRFSDAPPERIKGPFRMTLYHLPFLPNEQGERRAVVIAEVSGDGS